MTTNESNSSAFERERKFLVAKVPQLLNNGVEIKQGYIAIDGDLSVRVRSSDGAAWKLTIKTGRGAIRTELECAITQHTFEVAWQHTQDRCVTKTRYKIPIESGVIAELDIFQSQLAGLMMVEVEFPTDAELHEFTPPGWFGREVTEDGDFTNLSLSMNALELIRGKAIIED